MGRGHSAVIACLLAAWVGVVGAQGFGSVTGSSSDVPPPPDPGATEAVDAGAATTGAPSQAPAFSSLPAGGNPFLTGSAARAAADAGAPVPVATSQPAADDSSAFATGGAPAAADPASNPFLTGSAAAAAAAASNPFLTGSAAHRVAWMPSWPAPAATVAANTAPPSLSAAGSGPDLGASAGSLAFGSSYAEAIAGPARIRAPADRILVKKSERRLYLLKGGQVIAEYPIRLGLNPTGPKRYEGDYRTPEGRYELVRRNSNSEFFLSLEVSYPNEQDLARARELGMPPGGLIMIHGQPNLPTKSAEYYASNDWTNGCIAVSNHDMVDIWLRTDLGTPIEIRP